MPLLLYTSIFKQRSVSWFTMTYLKTYLLTAFPPPSKGSLPSSNKAITYGLGIERPACRKNIRKKHLFKLWSSWRDHHHKGTKERSEGCSLKWDDKLQAGQNKTIHVLRTVKQKFSHLLRGSPSNSQWQM